MLTFNLRPPRLLFLSTGRKSLASLRSVLLGNPRAAQEVMIVRTLKEFRPHEAFRALAKEADPQGAYRVLEGDPGRNAGRCACQEEA